MPSSVGELGLVPVAAVDADLDLVDAAVLRPGDAGDGRPAPALTRANDRGTSMRLEVLIGASAA